MAPFKNSTRPAMPLPLASISSSSKPIIGEPVAEQLLRTCCGVRSSDPLSTESSGDFAEELSAEPRCDVGTALALAGDGTTAIAAAVAAAALCTGAVGSQLQVPHDCCCLRELGKGGGSPKSGSCDGDGEEGGASNKQRGLEASCELLGEERLLGVEVGL